LSLACLFQPSLMFAGKARAFPIEAPFTRVRPELSEDRSGAPL
jgi:hypothetical protein